MFESIINFFKKIGKQDKTKNHSKDAAKERLHLVLMQDRANVSADFLDLMKQEIIEVIKKYIDVDENEIDVRLANKTNEDGTTGAPALYANIPIISIKDEAKKGVEKHEEVENRKEDNVGEIINRQGTESEENKERFNTDNNDDENKENKDNVEVIINHLEEENKEEKFEETKIEVSSIVEEKKEDIKQEENENTNKEETEKIQDDKEDEKQEDLDKEKKNEAETKK